MSLLGLSSQLKSNISNASKLILLKMSLLNWGRAKIRRWLQCIELSLTRKWISRVRIRCNLLYLKSRRTILGALKVSLKPQTQICARQLIAKTQALREWISQAEGGFRWSEAWMQVILLNGVNIKKGQLWHSMTCNQSRRSWRVHPSRWLASWEKRKSD